MLFRNTHAIYSDKEVYSNFLWNSNEEDCGFVLENTGANYVTKSENFLNNITCLHTKELRTVLDEGSEYNELKLSLRDIMEDIKVYFYKYNYGSLYWWVDTGYNLHIEHIKYFEITGTTVDVSDLMVRPMKIYKYNTNELKNIIIYDQINSGYKDFADNKIEYNILNKSISDFNKLEIATKYITTDLLYCVTNPNNTKNGLILINHDENGVVLYGKSFIDNNNILNGNLSLSSLLNRFGRYEGSWYSGKINGIDVSFEHLLRIKEGEEISIHGIIDWMFFTTDLGNGGLITSITHDFNSQITKTKITYRDDFWLMAQMATDFDGAEDIYLDLGFYI
jgi:hypothetical protein